MPFDTLEIQISLQKLLIGLILVIVPLSFVGLYLTSEADTSLKQTIGAHFRSIAQTESTAASQFINDRVLDVAALARNPAVVDAITAAQRKGFDDAVIAARIGKIERTWETPQVDPLVKEILSSPTSQVLRHHREADPRFLKVLVADETRATVAATHKPLHYVQPNEVYWQAVYGEGRGGIYVSEVRYDDQTKANYLDIGAPVVEEGTRRFIGAVNALVDVSSLLFRFQREEIGGQTARIMLVQDDGTVISALNMDPSLRLKSDEYAIVHDVLGTPQGRQAGYVVANMRGGNRIVGFADIGLKRTYPNLGWLILVSQDEREALAPLRGLSRFALLMVVLAFLMLTLLTVYFSLHRRQRFEDIDVEAAQEPPTSGAAAA
jgi:hypothetical protein